MAASNLDKFKKATRKFSTTVGSGGITDIATILPLSSTTGVDTDTAVVVTVDATDAQGKETPDVEEVMVGVVSGSTLISLRRGLEGTNQIGHAAGTTVTMYFTETHWDDLINGLLVTLNNDGTLKTGIVATTMIQDGAVTATKVAAGALSPTGAVMGFAGSSAPTGWLLADGTAVSRTTYATLFALVSTTYGVGDGSTTFNVPDLRGRVGVGKNSGTFPALAGTGGEETHVLTVPEIPAHHHQISGAGVAGPGGGGVTIGGASQFNTSDAGGGGSHNNLQPYLVLNYIIKT